MSTEKLRPCTAEAMIGRERTLSSPLTLPPSPFLLLSRFFNLNGFLVNFLAVCLRFVCTCVISFCAASSGFAPGFVPGSLSPKPLAATPPLFSPSKVRGGGGRFDREKFSRCRLHQQKCLFKSSIWRLSSCSNTVLMFQFQAHLN